MPYQEEIFEFDVEQQSYAKEYLVHDISHDPDLDSTPINVASSSIVGSLKPSLVAPSEAFVSSRDLLSRYHVIRSNVDSLKCDLDQLLLIQNSSENTLWSFLHQSIMEVEQQLSNIEGSFAKSNESNNTFDQLLDNHLKQQAVCDSVAVSNSTEVKRLDTLEKYIGTKICTGTFWNVSSVLAELESKLEALQYPSDRQRIVSKMSSLRSELDIFLSKISTDSLKSIVELNNGIEKFEAIIDNLPIVSSRLRTLDVIHWKANNFVKLVDDLEDGLTRLEAVTTSNKELCDALSKQLTINLEVMRQNVEKIENRLTKLE